jgi:hypothetical protein
MLDDSSVSRRQVLGVFTLGTAVALAGCSGGSGGSNGSGSDGATAGSTSTETSTATEQPDTETSTASNQDSMDEENEIQYWQNVDGLSNFEKAIYNEAENAEDGYVLTLDASQIDADGLEPTEVMDEYGKRPTLEHGLYDAVNGEYEDVTEIVLGIKEPEGSQWPIGQGVHVLDGDGNHIGSEGAYSKTGEGQKDDLRHCDDAVMYSTELDEDIEQVLME